jgi:hypothetical protein
MPPPSSGFGATPQAAPPWTPTSQVHCEAGAAARRIGGEAGRATARGWPGGTGNGGIDTETGGKGASSALPAALASRGCGSTARAAASASADTTSAQVSPSTTLRASGTCPPPIRSSPRLGRSPSIVTRNMRCPGSGGPGWNLSVLSLTSRTNSVSVPQLPGARYSRLTASSSSLASAVPPPAKAPRTTGATITPAKSLGVHVCTGSSISRRQRCRQAGGLDVQPVRDRHGSAHMDP